MPVIPATQRLRQRNHLNREAEVAVSLGNKSETPSQKKKSLEPEVLANSEVETKC